MKVTLQLLREEKEMIEDLISTGNYDFMKEYLVKTEAKIADLENRMMTEAERVKREGKF